MDSQRPAVETRAQTVTNFAGRASPWKWSEEEMQSQGVPVNGGSDSTFYQLNTSRSSQFAFFVLSGRQWYTPDLKSIDIKMVLLSCKLFKK
jgi:hypothetical protein